MLYGLFYKSKCFMRNLIIAIDGSCIDKGQGLY